MDYLEHRKLILHIVFQIAKARTVTSIQAAQLALKDSLIQDLADADAATGSLIAVAGTDALTGGADLATTQTGLLETIDHRVQVEADVGAIGDEDALGGALKALLLQGSQLLEEARDVDDGTGADEVHARGRDEAGGEDVEVVGFVAVDDGVTGIYIWSE